MPGHLPAPTATVVVVMGVAGVGKSTVGALLADALRVPFLDADDFHDDAARDKMRAGIPLDDGDRAPWLRRLNAALLEHPDGVVLAASALTPTSRAALADGIDTVRFVMLDGDPGLIERRLAARVGHFAGPGLLPSQLAILEPPADAIVLDVALAPAALVEQAITALGAPTGVPDVDE